MKFPANLFIKQLKKHLFTNASRNNFSISSKAYESSKQNKKKICIVGAGPAGFYAAQYMLKKLEDCSVDMIEKLPVPFGLVRYGVAPDHPEVKNVINTFTKTAENPRFRFFGNLSLGLDFSLQELREHYHVVLLTYGADQDRHLNIPNENQSNVISARKFVAWYNGLPGATELNPDLNGKTVTIVGQGNVAVDVARMLLTPVDILKKTDTTEYALESFSRSKVECVHLVGRRGPLQAAFTIKELREMLKLSNVQTIWRPTDFEGISDQLANLPRPRKRITELMLKSLLEQSPHPEKGKKLFLPIFLRAPSKIVDNCLECAVTKLENNTAVLTENTEQVPADLILRSIGYQSTCVDNGICFDKRHGYVFNENGRVLLDAESKAIDKGLYVAGWVGTGPTGVIVTTMNGAFAVAKTICDDILSNQVDTKVLKPELSVKDRRVVSWEGWKEIDKAEKAAGLLKGKPLEKIVDIDLMLKTAGV